MRPVALSVDGFTCFRDPQGPIDFSSLEVFAITGPTGAGKSSLLDAMIYALYGKMPRVGKRGYTECISLGRDRVAVRFDFRLGDRTYRLTRTARRRGAPQAILEAVDGDTVRPLADGVRQVDQAVERLVGLGYDAFIQAVVLPQGEFAKFLRSPARDRQAILREILRFQVYEHMRKLGAERARTLDTTLRSLRERLDTDYAGATPEAVVALEAELRDAEAANAHFARERREADRVLAEVAAAHEKTVELRAKRRALEALLAREPAIEEATRRLDEARRAAPVAVALAAAAEAATRAADAERQRGTAAQALERARRDHERALDHAERARTASERLPSLNARIRALDELRGVTEARRAAVERHARATAQLEKWTRERDAAARAAADARARHEQARTEHETAERALAELGYDPALHERLAAERDAATALAALRAEAGAAVARATQEAARAAELERAAGAAEGAAAAARAAHEDAEAATIAARRAHLDATARHAAHRLRGALVVGGDCPVCAQTVPALPPAGEAPELDVLERRVAKLERAEAAAGTAAREAESAAGRARAGAEHQAAAAAQAASTAAELAERLATNDARLTEAAGSLIARQPGGDIEARLRAALDALNAVRLRHDSAAAVRDRAQSAATEAGHALETARERERAAAHAASECEDAVAEVARELAEHDRRIAAVTSEPDPMVEREAVAAEAKRLEDERRTADAAEADRRAELSAAEAHATGTAAAAADAREASDEAAARAQRDATKAGFASAAAVRAALLATPEAERLEAEIAGHRSDREAHEQRVRELEAALAGSEVGDDGLETARTAARELASAAEAGVRKAAAYEQRLGDLRTKVAAASELAARVAATEASQALHARLAHDLRSDGFQSFLLEEVFRELVRGASARLWELSGRYTFDYHADAFHVLDRDNARERRSAETLSGGETFLASLALALELSEQVQRAAGAVVLDSIFIDEGFGSLDPETLETVAGAIEALPIGGRMVGIISHVPELTARLPARLEVRKSAAGSQVVGPVE